MTIRPVTEFGGYYGLEFPLHNEIHSAAKGYQSARAALLSLLRVLQPRRLWIPAFICGSMNEPAAACGVEIIYYRLSRNLYPLMTPLLDEHDLCLFVNYFGICRSQVMAITASLGVERLIIDNSQALFEKPTAHIGILYSPRKFVPSPDGGYLYVNGCSVDPPTHEDSGTFDRLRGMMMRTTCSAREGYKAFVDGEKSLAGNEPQRMSRITRRILASHDYDRVASKRRTNFQTAHHRLGHLNQFPVDIGVDCVPLVYPLVLSFDCTTIKAELHREGIFVPTYWCDTAAPLASNDPEMFFVKNTIYVPIDQRLSDADMLWILDVINEKVIRASEHSAKRSEPT